MWHWKVGKFVAPRVVAYIALIRQTPLMSQKKTKKFKNVKYHQNSLDSSGLKNNSQDFGYMLGVLHYVPNAKAAIKSCVKLLKPGAPILLYIYYALITVHYGLSIYGNCLTCLD